MLLGPFCAPCQIDHISVTAPDLDLQKLGPEMCVVPPCGAAEFICKARGKHDGLKQIRVSSKGEHYSDHHNEEEGEKQNFKKPHNLQGVSQCSLVQVATLKSGCSNRPEAQKHWSIVILSGEAR